MILFSRQLRCVLENTLRECSLPKSKLLGNTPQELRSTESCLLENQLQEDSLFSAQKSVS